MEKEHPLRFEMDQLVSYDDESLLNELRRVAALIPEQVITRERYMRYGQASAVTLARRFGGWKGALDRAGLSDRYSGKPVSETMKDKQSLRLSNEQVVSEMRRIAELLGTNVLRQEDITLHSRIMSPKKCLARFGTWRAALDAAGLSISSTGRRWTDDDYFENLLDVWTHYGRSPKCSDMDGPPSRISCSGYAGKFGSWGKAKLAFVNRVNANPVEILESAQPAKRVESAGSRPKPEDQHKIPIGLRYKVLSRDHFRCVSCGNSPATDVGCILHVDHILAFSRGGKTRMDNLQSKCAKCNIGKGNR